MITGKGMSSIAKYDLASYFKSRTRDDERGSGIEYHLSSNLRQFP